MVADFRHFVMGSHPYLVKQPDADVSAAPASGVAARSAKVPSDAMLVVEAQQGSTWAMGTLMRRHVPRVHAIALALIGRDADLDDLVQESFAQAVQSIGKLKAPSAFGSWLSAIVVSTAGKTFRRRRLLTRVGLASRDPVEVEIENLTAPTASPEVAADLSAVYAAIEGLQAQSREALLLRRLEGLRLDEIAERMNLSVSTVKRRLGTAQEALDAVKSGDVRAPSSPEIHAAPLK
jgi:RNA polymerase sigma-70 factor (ECF subfamily)